MFRTLIYLSDFTLFVLLSAALAIFSIICLLLVRRFLPINLRYHENAVVGSISGLISIIYGVLVGLMALFLMNNINYASNAVVTEGNAIADLYRYSRWLDDPVRSKLQDNIQLYLTQAINTEWPLMKLGKDSGNQGHFIIHNITSELLTYHATNPNQSMVVHDMLDSVKTLFDARQQRIQMSFSELNSQIWMVVFVGTILILVITFFFGLNFYLHILMSVSVSVMAASMLFLLITLDRPFQGQFAIEPIFFQNLLVFMQEQSESAKDIPARPNSR